MPTSMLPHRASAFPIAAIGLARLTFTFESSDYPLMISQLFYDTFDRPLESPRRLLHPRQSAERGVGHATIYRRGKRTLHFEPKR